MRKRIGEDHCSVKGRRRKSDISVLLATVQPSIHLVGMKRVASLLLFTDAVEDSTKFIDKRR